MIFLQVAGILFGLFWPGIFVHAWLRKPSAREQYAVWKVWWAITALFAIIGVASLFLEHH